MRPRSDVDPELHVLRSAAQSLDGRIRQQVESARFNLFAAFEAQDAALAHRWADALRAALCNVEAGELRRISEAALSRIVEAIDARS